MRKYPTVLFSLFIISSIIAVSTIENSFADDVIAISTGFDDSTILELKNSRGSSSNIDTVRIWLSEENEFKSFKTEQGWMGKKELNGVIEFKSQNDINPGESVKFGIKTIKQNPTINWKALDESGEIIYASSIKTLKTNTEDTGLNETVIIAIKNDSNFRLIPETPTSNSEFRVVGEKFIPNQSLDFYIGDELHKTIMTDDDGNLLFTAKTPQKTNDERTEFVLMDSGGSEKILSIRIPQVENREIAKEIKLSLDNTPKEAKRGEIISLEGMATPNTTLTITSMLPNGDILNIDTIQTEFNGKWSFEHLFSPELDLDVVSMEISDGKNKILRNIQVISAKLININTEKTSYEVGDLVSFKGSAIPNKSMSVILEDSIGADIFSRNISVGETGNVDFEIEIPRGSVEGTYVLSAFQDNEDGIAIFGVGQEPEPILILRPSKLNYLSGEAIKISIQGSTNAQVALILIDSADREKFSDSINLGPDGREIYEINPDDLTTGAYTLDAKRGESSGSALFTIGLSKGSGAISIQTTRDHYKVGEQILILGNTATVNVLLDIMITDTNGQIIKKVETFSNKFGVFKIDNFRIPLDGIKGTWTINAKSGGNFMESNFDVIDDSEKLMLKINKTNYNNNEIMSIEGDGARSSSTITIKIMNSGDNIIQTLNITAKNNGEFATVWQIPADLELGEYDILADDGKTNAAIKFTIN